MLTRVVLIIALLACPSAALAQLRIIFFGNSYTQGFMSTRDVPGLVRDIATAAQRPTPQVRMVAFGGASLEWHAQVSVPQIPAGMGEGETWDYVVMQDFSTMPTHIGLQYHTWGYRALYEAVRQHSPGVRAVAFETWARAEGNAFYEPGGAFPGGPAQMQQELRQGYRMSTDLVNGLYGAGTSIIAPVGDSWECAGWTGLHADGSHPANPGTLLAALVIYGTIYHDSTITSIDLRAVVDSLGLTEQQGWFISTAAQRALLTAAADFNDDGLRNPDDLSDFITCFFLDVQFPGMCDRADANQDGYRNPDDLTDFITWFFTAC